MNIVCVICCISAAIFAAEAACKSSLTAFEQAALDAHNTVRRLHEDTRDLCYGETGSDISFFAQAWAEEIASDKQMSHSTSSQYYDSSNPYGENLAYAGTTGTVRAEVAAYEYSTQAWYDEISDWSFSSNSGTGGVTGHFTQVIWKNTEQVNCGYATYYDSPYNSYMVVCQYYPAGNYGGQYDTNVLPLGENNSNDDNSDDDNSDDNNSNDNNYNDNTDDNTDDNSGDSAGFATFNKTVFAFVAAAILRLVA